MPQTKGYLRAIKTCVLIGIVILTGCASPFITVLRDDTFKSSMVNSLACMPFVKGRRCTEAPSGEIALLDCRLSAINYPIELYSDGASQEISYILHEELKNKYDAAVKNYNASMSVFKRLTRDHPHRTLRSLASAFARELGVEYAMIGILDSYIEREGRASGVERPASVGFSLYILHAPTNSVVFEGTFSETQQSLFENPLKASSFFKRGARWVSAGELSREGIADILADIP
jgi:hypothetical protein